MNRTDVHELTAAIASGDTDAFARFYEVWFDRLVDESRRVTGRDESFCLDVVQDAMMRVIRSLKPMHDEASLRAWLRTVVKSCAYDRLRSERRRGERERHVAAPEQASTEDVDERLAWLREELARLDAPHLHLLHLRHRLGWTLDRIGTTVGLRTGAVDGRISRIVSGLRRRATKELEDA